MKPQAILFDSDGVLVDSEPVVFRLIQEDLAAHGLHMTIAEMMPLFIGHTIGKTADGARARGANLPEDWSETFYTRMCARLAEGTALMPGVADLLDRLDAEGIPYAVGSNGRMTKMRATLGQHPAVWDKLKDKLFSGQDLGLLKPAPDLYLTAARSLGADPAQCVVIEDTPTGARAGIAAGMRVLGHSPHGENPALAAVGAEVFTHMDQVPGLIGL